MKCGRFPAVDYFGDGSFYLLDSPGHAIGHMCALARTTPDTFIFMGGDICHSPGNYRPTRAFPLPDPVPSGQLNAAFPKPCPCSLFTPLHRAHPDVDKTRTTPFFGLSRTENSTFMDIPAANNSIDAMREFEESSDVFVCISHDMALINVLPLLNKNPKADINDWKVQGYKEDARWFWLNELPRDGKPGQPPLVNGRFWRGREVKSWTDPVPDTLDVK